MRRAAVAAAPTAATPPAIAAAPHLLPDFSGACDARERVVDGLLRFDVVADFVARVLGAAGAFAAVFALAFRVPVVPVLRVAFDPVDAVLEARGARRRAGFGVDVGVDEVSGVSAMTISLLIGSRA